MARIVTETITLNISKIVKDDADDQMSWLTESEQELIGAVIEQLDEELVGAVVELGDQSADTGNE